GLRGSHGASGGGRYFAAPPRNAGAAGAQRRLVLRKVWHEVVRGACWHVAQPLVPPVSRLVSTLFGGWVSNQKRPHEWGRGRQECLRYECGLGIMVKDEFSTFKRHSAWFAQRASQTL